MDNDNVYDLTNILKEIEDVAEEIILKAIELTKDLAEEESEIVDDVSEILGEEFDSNIIIEKAVDFIDEMTSDAKNVHREVENFSRYVIYGEGEKETEFFQKVWYGDMYDKSGIPGLRALLGDLKKQSLLLTDDNIIKFVSDTLSNKTTKEYA